MSPFVFGCLLLPDAADVVRRYRGEKEENDVHDDLDVGTVEVLTQALAALCNLSVDGALFFLLPCLFVASLT